jgi:hypothetical protein
MSSQTTPVNTNSQMTVNTDLSKIFLWNNRYDKAQYTNGTGAAVTLLAGTVLGRITASGKLLPLKSAPAIGEEGSEIPLGILAHDVTVANGATVDLSYCVAGDVAQEKIILQGADTLDTVISARRIRDRITGDTMGIKLVSGTEMTAFDNS